jgi:hypothetical protein
MTANDAYYTNGYDVHDAPAGLISLYLYFSDLCTNSSKQVDYIL